MKIVIYLYKALRKIKRNLITPLYTPYGKLILFLNGAEFGENLIVNGIPKIKIAQKAVVKIGTNFKVNSGKNYNVIGRFQKTILYVDGRLTIGNNVGMSSTAIICMHEINIGNHVIFGGNTVVYDTDFHSLDIDVRKSSNDKKSAIKKPVVINDNVFIGAHTTILKGVTIGENAIIGACSVVTKDVPANEIWAGNPARFIKKM